MKIAQQALTHKLFYPNATVTGCAPEAMHFRYLKKEAATDFDPDLLISAEEVFSALSYLAIDELIHGKKPSREDITREGQRSVDNFFGMNNWFHIANADPEEIAEQCYGCVLELVKQNIDLVRLAMRTPYRNIPKQINQVRITPREKASEYRADWHDRLMFKAMGRDGDVEES